MAERRRGKVDYFPSRNDNDWYVSAIIFERTSRSLHFSLLNTFPFAIIQLNGRAFACRTLWPNYCRLSWLMDNTFRSPAMELLLKRHSTWMGRSHKLISCTANMSHWSAHTCGGGGGQEQRVSLQNYAKELIEVYLDLLFVGTWRRIFFRKYLWVTHYSLTLRFDTKRCPTLPANDL